LSPGQYLTAESPPESALQGTNQAYLSTIRPTNRNTSQVLLSWAFGHWHCKITMARPGVGMSNLEEMKSRERFRYPLEVGDDGTFQQYPWTGKCCIDAPLAGDEPASGHPS
jgi:hypothetical protein